MTIDRIRYFHAVVNTGNLRKAAELLGISASSLSKALSVLQLETGSPLIRPEGRGIAITEHGMRFHQLTLRLVDEYRRLQENLNSPSSANPVSTLRLGTFEVFSTRFAAALIQAELSNYQVLLRELTPGNIESALTDGSIDCGLTYIPSPSGALEFTKIGNFKLGIYGLPSWSKLPFEHWDFAAPVSSLPVSAQEHVSLDLWPSFKQARRVKYELEQLETALQIAHDGTAVIHCPDFVVQLFNQRNSNGKDLVALEYPRRMKQPDPVSVFFVARKGDSGPTFLLKRIARFWRSLNQ